MNWHCRLWRMVLVWLLLIGMVPVLPVSAALLFGPERIEVANGKPVNLSRSFRAAAGSRAILSLSGGEGKKVSSGTVLLNGSKIVAPAAFNQQVSTVEREVELAAENRLEMSFAGPPGSFVVVSIGSDSDSQQGPVVSFDPLPDGPLDGATVTTGNLTVSGLLAGGDLNDVGVVVNGFPAQGFGNRFIANHVPLILGVNTLRAVATDAAGRTSEAHAQVTFVPSEEGASLDALDEAGLAPMSLELMTSTTFGWATGPKVSCSGPVAVTLVSLEDQRYGAELTQPGLYLCTFEVSTKDGAHYRDRVGINVYAITEFDALLQSRWQGMRTALTAGDIEGALGQFTIRSQEKYRNTFVRLQTQLPALAQQMREPEYEFIHGGIARYRVVREQEFNGRILPMSYDVYFVRDIDGRWKLDEF